MKATYIPCGDLSTWLFSKSPSFKIPSRVPPTMLATIQVWNKFVCLSHDYPDKITLKIQILALQNNIDLISYTKWREKGILHIKDLFSDNVLKAFPDLQREYRLPSSDLYIYLRTRHCLHTSPPWERNIPRPTWLFLSNPKPMQKGISLFYNILQQKKYLLHNGPSD